MRYYVGDKIVYKGGNFLSHGVVVGIRPLLMPTQDQYYDIVFDSETFGDRMYTVNEHNIVIDIIATMQDKIECLSTL